jgi:hypothetical protein
MRIRSLLAAGVAALALAVAGPAAAQVAPADQPAQPETAPGAFTIEFDTFKKANRRAGSILRRSGAMQAIADEVNSRWSIPREIPVVFGDDLEIGPAFIPDLKLEDGTVLNFINMPGTFIRLELQEFRREIRREKIKGLKPKQALIYATEFVLAHEMGHALVHELKLPITGKEEDAVDGFAAYLLADNPKFGPMTAISAAMFFDLYTRIRGKLTQEDFADEHSLLEQRVYQFLCWVYGSDPKRFKGLVGKDLLPRERARRCPNEWKQVTSSWDTLLKPYEKAAPQTPATEPTQAPAA